MLNELLAAQRAIVHREEAERRGISVEELHRIKYRLKVAWEEGGGMNAARARLKFAQDFLARERAANGEVKAAPLRGVEP